MNKANKIIGWILSVAVSGIFVLGAVGMLSHNPKAVEMLTKLGFPHWFFTFIGIAYIVAIVLHLIPRTAFALFGAILMTGYFGGTIAIHLELGDGQWWSRVVMGMLPWLGLYLRDARFNALMSFWQPIAPVARSD